MRGWSSLESGRSVDDLVAFPFGSGGRPLIVGCRVVSLSDDLFFLCFFF